MNDYKELVEILRDDEFCGKLDYIDDAADAIVQLVKERDYAMDIANNTHHSAMIKLQKNDETIAGLFRDRDVLQRKLDAAVADITELVTKHGTCICDLCRFYDGMECSIQKGCKWEWRGV